MIASWYLFTLKYQLIYTSNLLDSGILLKFVFINNSYYEKKYSNNHKNNQVKEYNNIEEV